MTVKMMDENAPPRKRIATYGKAVRKRLPEYFGSKEQIKTPHSADESLGDGSHSHLHHTYALPRVSRSQPSSPAPSITSGVSNVFDFPSSEEDQNMTPKKRRKINSADVHTTVTSPQVKKLSRRTPDRSVSGGNTYDHGRSRTMTSVAAIHSGRVKEPRTSQKDKELSDDMSTANRKQMHSGDLAQRPSKKIQSKLDGDSNPRTAPKYQAKSPKVEFVGIPETTHGATSKAQEYRSTDHEGHSSSSSSPSRPALQKELKEDQYDYSQRTSPAVLTPKGRKMWDGLLGGDSDPFPQNQIGSPPTESVNGHAETSRHGQPPRRRLIDSLVKQSTNLMDVDDNTSESSGESEPFKAIDVESPRDSRFDVKADAVADGSLKTLTSNIASAAQVAGPKITYSRQRSMLAEPDFAESIDPEVNDHPFQFQGRQQNRKGPHSGATLLPALQVTDEDEDISGGAIRSVHELRQAGATKRYLDEMEDLLDRIGDPRKKPSLRRSGLVEMAEKLHDKEFRRNFISNAGDQRLFSHLERESDTISGFLIAAILLIILDEGMTPLGVSHLCNQGTATILGHLLDVQDSVTVIAKDRKSNMSKAAQMMLADEQDRLLRLGVWEAPKPQVLTPRTLALTCLEHLLRRVREAGDRGDFITKDVIKKLFTILEPLLQLNSRDEFHRLQTVDVRLSLSILEAQSLSVIEAGREWFDQYLPVIRDTLKNVMATLPDEEGSLQILILRLTLNVTNNSSNASDLFADPKLISTMSQAIVNKLNALSHFLVEAERLTVVDHLVLILGVMINFAEWSRHARQCFVTLTDTNGDPLADMVKSFSENLEKTSEADSMEGIHLNVAFGYLSVLLGTLCLSGDIADRARVLLPGKSLEPLITSIEEFISHHKKVDSLLQDEVNEHEPQTGLTERLSRVVEALREREV